MIGPDGSKSLFENAWFRYRPNHFGATGNIDLVDSAEDQTRNAIASRLRGDEIFYDVGAHGGLYSVTLKKKFPNLKIYSFEPQPDDLIFNLLLNDMSSENVHAVAVGDEPSTVRMTTGHRSSNHIDNKGELTVPLVRLDEYVAQESLPMPSWIKIDIEGMELRALRGAERILRTSRPVVICEINHLYGRYGTKISEFMDFMISVGLHPHKLKDGVLEKIEQHRTFEELGNSADRNFWFIHESFGVDSAGWERKSAYA